MNATTSPLFQSLRTSLQNLGWQFQPIENREVVEAHFEAHHTRLHITVQAFPELSAISVVAEAPGALQPFHIPKAAELLMRANLQLTLGNFELQWDSGRTFFRLTNLFPNTTPSDSTIGSMVHSAVAEMDRMAACLGEVSLCSKESIHQLDTGRLLRREDLFPPIPDEPSEPS